MITKYVDDPGKVLIVHNYEFLGGTVLLYCGCFVVIDNFCPKNKWHLLWCSEEVDVR